MLSFSKPSSFQRNCFYRSGLIGFESDLISEQIMILSPNESCEFRKRAGYLGLKYSWVYPGECESLSFPIFPCTTTDYLPGGKNTGGQRRQRPAVKTREKYRRAPRNPKKREHEPTTNSIVMSEKRRFLCISLAFEHFVVDPVREILVSIFTVRPQTLFFFFSRFGSSSSSISRRRHRRRFSGRAEEDH